MLALLPQTLTLPGGGTASGWYIYALATDPGARSKGYGRQLLRFVDGYLAERGADCVTTVPAEPSLFKFFGTVGFAPCFSTRKLELLKSMLSPRRRATGQNPWSGGVQRHPAPPAGGGARRGLPGRADPLPAGHGRLSGGGLYRLSVDGAEAAPPPSTPTGRVCCSRSCCCPRTRWAAGWRRWNGCSPGRAAMCAPLHYGWHEGSYLQPFGMIKWYSAEKRALWGEGTHGYMGLGFD